MIGIFKIQSIAIGKIRNVVNVIRTITLFDPHEKDIQILRMFGVHFQNIKYLIVH